jgi:NAD-dependent DNA ligase
MKELSADLSPRIITHQEVGSELTEEFVQVHHSGRYVTGNTFSEEELADFGEKVKRYWDMNLICMRAEV